MRAVLILLFHIVILSFFQVCFPQNSEIIVAEYGKYSITLNEFEKAYAKNSGGIQNVKNDSLENRKKFLDLYVNFKMKLRNAKVRGYDKNEDLQNELLDYKERVGVSYIEEKLIIDPAIRKLYDRRKYEMRVSHILIRPDSITDERASAIADSLLNRIKSGEKFEDLVSQYSSDHFSKNIGGDIYYITSGQIIPEFEDAVYNTPVGTVYPEAVKTRYGYHIIKVTDKQNRIPQIKARHILVDFTNEDGEIDTSAALNKINDLRKQIVEGADFGELAKVHSADKGSGAKGGDLGFFERRMMVKEFDEAAFLLDVGEVSDVVKTKYGFHLIELTDKKEEISFEEEKKKLTAGYKQNRYRADYDKFIDDLRDEFNYKLNESGVNFVLDEVDTTVIGPDYWESDYRMNVKDTILCFINGNPVIMDSLIRNIEKEPGYKQKKIMESTVRPGIQKYSADLLMKEKAKVLDKSNPEFADLMDEYRNGIYIFKLQEDEVWNKITSDSIKLSNYYESNKEDFKWNDRVNFDEIFSRRDSLINSYHEMLQNGEDFNELATKHTERPRYKEKAGNHGLMDWDTNDLSTKANSIETVGDFSKPFQSAGGWSIVKLIEKQPSRIKTYEEAKAEVASAFQEKESKRLENEYISKLKNVYEPVLFYDKLEQAFKPENE